MKNIFKSSLLLLSSICLLAACADDNDSNPTLTMPTTFQLNTPAFSQAVTDLSASSALPFTWSQPDYGGFPVAAQYQMQFSFNQSYTVSVAEAQADETGATKADYVALDQIYNGCSGTVNTSQLAKGLMQIAQWSSDEVPASVTIYARLVADYADSEIYSNIVPIIVRPYYVELKDADPVLWYLVGDCIADGSWGNNADGVGKTLLPLSPIEGQEYDKATGTGIIGYTGYFPAGGQFKMILTPGSWDDQLNYSNITKGSELADDLDGDNHNIGIKTAGYYTVKVDTKSDKVTIEEYTGSVKTFDGMAIAGTFNDWGDTAMNPSTTNAENHDWYITQSLDAGAKIKVKQAGSWDFNKGGSFVNLSNGMYVYGVSGGDDLIVEEAGEYLILFNDITGFIRFIKQ